MFKGAIHNIIVKKVVRCQGKMPGLRRWIKWEDFFRRIKNVKAWKCNVHRGNDIKDSLQEKCVAKTEKCITNYVTNYYLIIILLLVDNAQL